MRRFPAIIILLATTIAFSAGMAAATPPQHERITVDAVIPFPDICPFPLTAHVEGKNMAITFFDASGNAVRGSLHGQLFVTFTRDDTGLSRRFTISGPTFFAADGTAIRGTGRWTTPMFEVGWVLASGNLEFVGTEDGFALIGSVRGHVRPLCDLLA